MQLETKRLFILPLTAEQLALWVKNIGILEKQLVCKYRAEPMKGEFLDIVKDQIEQILNDQSNYLYHTFWLLIRKADRVVIGSADFKNIPDEHGEIEIGYGLGLGFEHNGYMTEAVKAMCDWALNQEKVKHVLAETEKNNQASQNVLKRCGFQLYNETKTLWWRL